MLPRLKERVIYKYNIIRAPAFDGVARVGRIAKGLIYKNNVYCQSYTVSDAGLCLEWKTVGALYNGGIRLVSSDLDLVKRAEILAAAVVLAVVDSTSDVLVCVFSSHNNSP